eukprot:TRINITY_DN2674_c0_g1_i2.p1 TRINITY_DN2674_c0_g1~~TRINITY_DN2674_c0_g1_i2.p1  ORF type:complete len:119 (-),score=21.02 TRINITY_DN2674_c0_g1_i2:21-377(-)
MVRYRSAGARLEVELKVNIHEVADYIEEHGQLALGAQKGHSDRQTSCFFAESKQKTMELVMQPPQSDIYRQTLTEAGTRVGLQAHVVQLAGHLADHTRVTAHGSHVVLADGALAHCTL